jgi:chromosome transmission fidelity protein 1
MAPKDFHHPFQPYSIQQEFMQAVYDCIEDGKVGIFESPTGTGKSLSLICGSLTWLREHKRKQFDEAIAAIDIDDDEPEWMVEHARDQRRRQARDLRDDFEARLDAVRKRESKLREKSANEEPFAKRRKQNPDDANEDEDQFLLDDYNSDDETSSSRNQPNQFSSETTKLMQKLGMLPTNGNENENMEEADELKIYFCSRTHSQLSQFIGELKRVKLPPGLPPEQDGDGAVEALKHLTLGSRKNLCINPRVAKLPTQTTVNERCIELQQSSTPADRKCPFLPKQEDQDLVLDFRDHALSKICDIEDLAAVGSRLQTCPYYASRPAIGPAEIVTLPYPLLLQKSAREALGISLRGHVVIIDEAHNLMSALEGIHSTEVTEGQLTTARDSIMTYLQKFRNRLKGANRVYVTQVVRVVGSLLHAISNAVKSGKATGHIATEELLSGKGADQVNLAKLVKYITDSKLARKVEGYNSYLKESTKSNAKTKSSTASDVPTLTHVQNFLMCLMNPSKEGRFFLSQRTSGPVIRYLLLDPSEHFREIVEDARTVILAGGTMSPMDDYKQQLFPYVSTFRTLSCGHLIPPANLLVRPISSDKNGPLEFTFKQRNNPMSAKRIGQALLHLAPHVRGGLVVFFPSYGYLDQVSAIWNQEGIMDSLKQLKSTYSDVRGGSAEETFKAYSDAVRTTDNGGALLLSVIGGKLSEGINFADDLGRCVVVVGLPFPNLDMPEWRAKMQYIENQAVARGMSKGSASRDHAENVCMRAVNQAIGRVIRHKDDWASILLMDSRYEQDRIKGKLPGWIRGCTPAKAASTRLEDVVEDVGRFFAQRQCYSSS